MGELTPDLSIRREAAKQRLGARTSDECWQVAQRVDALSVSDAHTYRAPLGGRAAFGCGAPRLDAALTERIQRLLEQHPTFGYRRLWVLLRFREGIPVNRKAVYRVLRLKGWLVHQRGFRGLQPKVVA